MAVSDNMCFLAFSHQYQHNFSFQSHQLVFSHALAEVKGENLPERILSLKKISLVKADLVGCIGV